MSRNGYRVNPFIERLRTTQQNNPINIPINNPIISNTQIARNNPLDQLLEDLNNIVIKKPSDAKKINREGDYLLVKKIYEEKIGSDMECLICFEDIQSPVIVLCCKQFFCGSCLNTWIYTNNSCPHCRDSDPMFYSPEITVEYL
jgi:hypothetical protein